jgi:hypothetical protein
MTVYVSGDVGRWSSTLRTELSRAASNDINFKVPEFWAIWLFGSSSSQTGSTADRNSVLARGNDHRATVAHFKVDGRLFGRDFVAASLMIRLDLLGGIEPLERLPDVVCMDHNEMRFCTRMFDIGHEPANIDVKQKSPAGSTGILK